MLSKMSRAKKLKRLFIPRAPTPSICSLESTLLLMLRATRAVIWFNTSQGVVVRVMKRVSLKERKRVLGRRKSSGSYCEFSWVP